MIFDKVNQELALADKAFSIGLHKSQANINCAVYEAALKMEDAEFKVMLESGTDDELVAYYEEAEEGLIAKVKRSISTIVETIKKFFSDLKDKVVSIFSKKDVEKSIDELEKKAKLPFFKSKKVTIPDVEGEEKCLAKWRAKYQTLLAKIKSGGKASQEEVTEMRESFLKEHATAIAATTTVTIATGIALAAKYYKKMAQDVDKTGKDTSDAIEKLQNVDGVDQESVNILVQAANHAADLGKKSGSFIITSVTKIISKIKGAGKEEVGDIPDEKVEESTTEVTPNSDIDLSDFDFLNESATEVESKNSDVNTENWFNEIFGV